MAKTCTCTGHRPKGFPFAYGKDTHKHKAYLEQLKRFILLAYYDYGADRFISGMALGVDLDFAETVLKLRDGERYPITLECALPCPNQTYKWEETDRLRYKNLLQRAD